MNLLLLLAMLQNIDIDIKPAPEFRMVSESVTVRSEYYEKVRSRILRATNIRPSERGGQKALIDDNLYYYYGFYFKGAEVPLPDEERRELYNIMYDRYQEQKERKKAKTLEQL